MALSKETRTPEVKTGSKSHPGFYVFSTLTAPNEYTLWVAKPKGQEGGPNIKKRSVLINGGANVVNKHYVTPRGVVTHVSAEDMELLKGNRTFRQHYDRGYLTATEKRGDPNEVAKSMTPKDHSAQIEPSDFEKGKTPTTGKVS